jgi:hypothetical protein
MQCNCYNMQILRFNKNPFFSKWFSKYGVTVIKSRVHFPGQSRLYWYFQQNQCLNIKKTYCTQHTYISMGPIWTWVPRATAQRTHCSDSNIMEHAVIVFNGYAPLCGWLIVDGWLVVIVQPSNISCIFRMRTSSRVHFFIVLRHRWACSHSENTWYIWWLDNNN